MLQGVPAPLRSRQMAGECGPPADAKAVQGKPGAAADPAQAPAGKAAALGLNPAEFTYIGRPAECFEGRWQAIGGVLAERFSTGQAFSLIDVGSNHGYFCLQTAAAYPEAFVMGVEGAVGCGNGSLGLSTRDAQRLAVTEACRTHLSWVEKLGLKNCHLAPEVWDLNKILELGQAGLRADVMLTLSVIHHIDGICEAEYKRLGKSHIEGSLELIAGILRLAHCHIVELPDKPWLDHLRSQFGGDEAVLREAAARAWPGGPTEMRRIHENKWMGLREVWLVEHRSGAAPSPCDVGALFPVLLPSKVPAGMVLTDTDVRPAVRSRTSDAERFAEPCEDLGGEPVTSDAEFVRRCMHGRWKNAYGNEIAISGEPPSVRCRYLEESEDRDVVWASAMWCLENRGGRFRLAAATGDGLVWQECTSGWKATWSRT